MRYQEHNEKMIDAWAKAGWEWSRPLTHAQCLDVLQDQWSILLTPLKPVPRSWIGECAGKKILGLASGGGQQMPVLSLLKADCTVLDFSREQLEREAETAAREGYSIRLIQGDMTNPFPFEDETFDMILHPVSNCYVRDVQFVWKECFRVLKNGGKLLAGFDSGISYVWNDDYSSMQFTLPFDPTIHEEQRAYALEHDWGFQFSHTLDEQIAGQLRAGFILKDLYQDTDTGPLGKYNLPLFIATLSEKP